MPYVPQSAEHSTYRDQCVRLAVPAEIIMNICVGIQIINVCVAAMTARKRRRLENLDLICWRTNQPTALVTYAYSTTVIDHCSPRLHYYTSSAQLKLEAMRFF